MLSVLQWKDEPVSPLNAEEASLLDDSFYQSSLDDLKFEHNDFEDCESKAEVASHILENLEKLVDLDELIKEEPSFLLDDKMIPLLEDIEPPRGAIAVPVPLKPEYYKAPEENATYLFNELVYYELNHGALTPPQSPPTGEQPNITILEPNLNNYNPVSIFTVPEKQLETQQVLGFPSIVQDSGNFHPQNDIIAQELAVVDELVRSTVEDMQWNNGPSSPESSSCSNSNFGDCSSSDPEWVPEPIEDYNGAPNQKAASRKRSKPYSQDDKKNRKKEQNKNAATRYRMKKKAEVEEILSEEKGLLDKHGELSTQVTDLQREIKYLKGLMRDLFKAKGVIS